MALPLALSAASRNLGVNRPLVWPLAPVGFLYAAVGVGTQAAHSTPSVDGLCHPATNGLLAGFRAACEGTFSGSNALLSLWPSDQPWLDGWKEVLLRVLGFVAAAAAGEALRAVVEDVGGRLWERIVELTTTTATIESHDEAYRWMLLWLADHPSFKTAHTYQITSSLQRNAQGDEEQRGETVRFTPGAGRHWLRFHNSFVFLQRTHSDSRYSDQGIRGTDRISVTMLGKSSARKQIALLIEEARLTALEKDKSLTIVHVGDQFGNWNRSTARSARPLSSVILEEGVADKLVNDSKEFLHSAKWYSSRGIPYRRGYLLHGKPGCGKTSFVTALAGELRMNIYVINLASRALNDEVLAELMRGVPYRGIVLFEDIDAAFVPGLSGEGSESEGEEETRSRTKDNGVTFSGLLNVLDGVASAEGRLIFFTTNHFSHLSKTLIRPGRVDVIVHVGLATVSQAKRMFYRFYEDHQEATLLAERFAALFIPEKVSMARLQGYLMDHKEDPEGAIACAVDSLFGAN